MTYFTNKLKGREREKGITRKTSSTGRNRREFIEHNLLKGVSRGRMVLGTIP